MKRSEIRGGTLIQARFPGFRFAPSGLPCCKSCSMTSWTSCFQMDLTRSASPCQHGLTKHLLSLSVSASHPFSLSGEGLFPGTSWRENVMQSAKPDLNRKDLLNAAFQLTVFALIAILILVSGFTLWEYARELRQARSAVLFVNPLTSSLPDFGELMTLIAEKNYFRVFLKLK